jgi:competence protein ComEA
MLKKILMLFVMMYAALAMAAAAAVDVNKANDAQLDAVKGIGPATTKAIMVERKKGDFKNWADFITRVKGVGDKKAEALSKEGLTVNGEAYKPTASSKKEDKKASKAEMKAEAAKPAASAKKK